MPRGRSHPEVPSLLTETRRLLRRYGLHARKRLGQHFLIDPGVLEVILEAASLTPNDVVIEVGPGLGVLTRELAKGAGRVVAVELDDSLAGALQKGLASLNNVSVVNGDVLKLALTDLLEESGSQGEYKVVANLPYYITSPVLRHFLEASVKPEIMVVMVQQEVAESITAGPGRMSLLSVSVQFYGEPAIIDSVPARCFYPSPEVDSAILKIIPYAQPVVAVDDSEGFFSVVRAGFSTSRKQLVNSLTLSLGLPKREVLAVLVGAGISPQRRAETLTLEEWSRLYHVFHAENQDRC